MDLKRRFKESYSKQPSNRLIPYTGMAVWSTCVSYNIAGALNTTVLKLYKSVRVHTHVHALYTHIKAEKSTCMHSVACQFLNAIETRGTLDHVMCDLPTCALECMWHDRCSLLIYITYVYSLVYSNLHYAYSYLLLYHIRTNIGEAIGKI